MYLGISESPIGSNSGEIVDEFNAHLSLKDVPWCATCQSMIQNLGKVESPFVNSARAISFKTGSYYNAKDILLGIYQPNPGDYMVKARRGGNHVDQVLYWNNLESWGLLIGCNVSDKIKIRKFTLDDLIRWGASIVEVTGNYDYKLSEKGVRLIENNLKISGVNLVLKYGK